MHRTVLRTGTAALAVAMLAAGTATLPGASGADGHEPRAEGRRGHDRHPARGAAEQRPPPQPGRPGQPRPPRGAPAPTAPPHHDRLGNGARLRYQTQGQLHRRRGRRRSLALHRPARPRRDRPSRQPRGRRAPPTRTARDLRARVTARRRVLGLQRRPPRGRREGQQGPGHGHRITARPGHPRLVRQPGQRGHHRGPVVTGLLRGRQLGVRLLPGQQLREVRPGAGRRKRRGAEQRCRRLAAAPLRPPEFRPRLRHRRNQARVDAVKPPTPTSTTGPSTSTTTAGSASPSCTSP